MIDELAAEQINAGREITATEIEGAKAKFRNSGSKPMPWTVPDVVRDEDATLLTRVGEASRVTFTTATDEQLDQLNLGLSERVNVKRGELVVPDINRQIELFSGKSVSRDHPKPERVPVEIGANVHVFEKWTLDDGTHIYSDTTEIAGPDSKPVEVRRTWYRGESALAQEVAERREWDPKREALGAAGQEAWDKSMSHLTNVGKGYLAMKMPVLAFAMIANAAKAAALSRAQKGQSNTQSVAGGIMDATGLTDLWEGVSDRELFTGRKLNQSIDQQIERAGAGVISGIISLIAGTKTILGRSRSGVPKVSKPAAPASAAVGDELTRMQGGNTVRNTGPVMDVPPGGANATSTNTVKNAGPTREVPTSEPAPSVQRRHEEPVNPIGKMEEGEMDRAAMAEDRIRATDRAAEPRPPNYTVDENNLTIRAHGEIYPAARGRAKGYAPEPVGGRAPGEHKGHMLPEGGAADRDLVNVRENINSEAPRSNLSTKKKVENYAIRLARENPDAVVTMTVDNLRKSGETRPFAVTVTIKMDGKTVYGVSVLNR